MVAAALSVLENAEQREELSEFYKKHKARFLNIAFNKLHNREEAEDAVQEAFLKIADRPEIFFGLDEIRRTRFFYGVIENVAVKMYNKNQKNHTEELAEDVVYQNEDDPIENSMMDKISRDEILAFIDSLPEAQRTVLALSYSSGLSADEIGIVLNISVSTVYQRLYSARKAVKHFIAERSENDV